jgi:DNA-binding NtrC family response regulator
MKLQTSSQGTQSMPRQSRIENHQKLFELAVKGNATVLISGPTGSGKTRLARSIHDKSPRRFKPFVTVNLASLHEGTFESELFGHERGSFTGADSKRVGKLEAAQGGTVFLDEVGELPPRLQARLLEFLQSRTISPVGSNRETRLDVRVIAATNKNLAACVAKGEFREDLFHRLRVLSIELKSLSERCDEFGELVHATLAEVCEANGRSILRLTPELADHLERYPWPGNLRELRNVLEYCVLATDGPEIGEQHLPIWFGDDPVERFRCADPALDEQTVRGFVGLDYGTAIELFEKLYLEHALEKNLWRINRTAREIRMNKTTLLRRMRVYGLVSK